MKIIILIIDDSDIVNELSQTLNYNIKSKNRSIKKSG